jgi:hypothetical protein
VLGVSLGADTLFLRNGERVQGQLISVRDGVVEFGAQRGFFGRERVRVDVADVTRIEFDRNNRPDNDYNDRPGGNNNDRPGGNSSSRPSGMRERAVVVNAAEQWQDTGVVVRADKLSILSRRGGCGGARPPGWTGRRTHCRATTY